MKKKLLFSLLVLMLLFSTSPVRAEDQPDTKPPAIVPTPAQQQSNINPLTGLPVADPALLKYPPAMISITNFPLSSRPQAGLSFSPITYELYIGEGMSRFLAAFYGEYPGMAVTKSGAGTTTSSTSSIKSDNSEIGPIRSGRLPYESLRSLYNGFLVMASAYKGVAANLDGATNIFGSDGDNINSAMIPVSKLQDIAMAQKPLAANQTLESNVFEAAVPANGKKADRLVYFYSNLNQLYWEYDKAKGAYVRYQDNADGKTFTAMSDKLTGEELTMENVIILYSNHRYCNETVLDIDLKFIKKNPAVLFRDGQMYKLFWTTLSGEYEQKTGYERPIRFIDEAGNPFPLKPGQTWVHLTPIYTRMWESPVTTDTIKYLSGKEEGSGQWVTRFYTDMMTFDQAVCDKVGMK